MTREEAIKTWLPIISMSIDNMPELKEAFDMAIKALEQEPKTGHGEIMSFTELTAETIERDYCPRCKYYIDKQFIYKDENIQINMGTVKECKFRTDTSWICDFKENENADSN